MKKALIVYNPRAGLKNIVDVFKYVKSEFQKKGWVFNEFISSRETFENIKDAVNRDYDFFLVIGGDGTVRQVAAAMVEKKIKEPLGIIPTGSANILAQALGIPLIPYQAARRIFSGKEKKIDVGMLNNKEFFFATCGFGSHALVVHRTKRSMKRAFGWTAYFFSAAFSFFSFSKNRYRITVDRKTYHLKAKSVVVINGFKVMAGLLGAKAKLDDGLLDCIVFNPKNIWDYLTIAFRLFFWPKRRSPAYSHFSGREIKIESNREVRGEMDGEPILLHKVEIRVLERRLRVIC